MRRKAVYGKHPRQMLPILGVPSFETPPFPQKLIAGKRLLGRLLSCRYRCHGRSFRPLMKFLQRCWLAQYPSGK